MSTHGVGVAARMRRPAGETSRRRGRPPLPGLDDRLAADVLAALERAGPLTADDLRTVVRGQARRVDQVVRMLAAGGVLARVSPRAGFVLADRWPR